MNRRTNLFYTSGPDSKFITFSNYAESMTGNFLSTDTKMFPSRFLTMNIDGLTEKSKSLIIKKLVEYYESKLAALRDNVENPEHKILPLNYLIEFLYSISSLSDDEITFEHGPGIIDTSTSYITSNVISYMYISEITEQDYNGQYADAIMNVDIDSHRHIESIKLKASDDDVERISINIPMKDDTTYTLYGWEDTTLSNYETSYSYFDNIEYVKRDTDIIGTYYGQYNVTSSLESAYLSDIAASRNNAFKFNAVIPLFDVCDINTTTNSTDIVELTYINLVDGTDNCLYTKNVPLGMWFSYEGKPIEIMRDANTGFSPSWSLTVSSQFKPFPYSSQNPVDMNTASGRGESFSTFAQILNAQNTVTDKINDTMYQIAALNNRIAKLETALSSSSNNYSIDKVYLEIENYKKKLNNEFSSFKTSIDTMLGNMKWQVIPSSTISEDSHISYEDNMNSLARKVDAIISYLGLEL